MTTECSTCSQDWDPSAMKRGRIWHRARMERYRDRWEIYQIPPQDHDATTLRRHLYRGEVAPMEECPNRSRDAYLDWIAQILYRWLLIRGGGYPGLLRASGNIETVDGSAMGRVIFE